MFSSIPEVFWNCFQTLEMIPHGHLKDRITCTVSSWRRGLDFYQPVSKASSLNASIWLHPHLVWGDTSKCYTWLETLNSSFTNSLFWFADSYQSFWILHRWGRAQSLGSLVFPRSSVFPDVVSLSRGHQSFPWSQPCIPGVWGLWKPGWWV